MGWVQEMDNPTGYLYRTAMNRFARSAAVRRSPPAGHSGRCGGATLDRVESRDEVDRPWRRCPRQREAVVLVDLLQFPADEAARVLGSHLRRYECNWPGDVSGPERTGECGWLSCTTSCRGGEASSGPSRVPSTVCGFAARAGAARGRSCPRPWRSSWPASPCGVSVTRSSDAARCPRRDPSRRPTSRGYGWPGRHHRRGPWRQHPRCLVTRCMRPDSAWELFHGRAGPRRAAHSVGARSGDRLSATSTAWQ